VVVSRDEKYNRLK